MKNFLKYSLFISIFFILSCGLTKSISDKSTEKISGKWIVSEFSINSSLLSQNIKQSNDLIFPILKGSVFNFENNKVYTLNLNKSEISGTWEISKDGNNLITKSINTNTYSISFIDSKTINLSNEENKFTLKLKKI